MMVSLLAVHLSDGALTTPWLASGFAGLAVLLAVAMYSLREDEVPRIGVLSAAFFVASSIHIKLPPTSAHLILNGLVGVVLGRRAPLAIAIGLTLQFFLLGHGGWTTLGVNSCIVSLPALAAGALYPVLRRLHVPAFVRGVLLGGGAVAVTVALNFFALLLGGKEDWQTLAKLVLLAHVPVVLVEGLMLGVLVRYLEKVKPELLNHQRTEERDQRTEGGEQKTENRRQRTES
jgi:cobalt/nickel transport system permease protein